MEKVGRKTFSKGVWATASHIVAARAALSAERQTPQYEKRRAADLVRREAEQGEDVVEFEQAVRAFLRFTPSLAALEAKPGRAVALHATPVGSGTVARTERIPVERRAEAAVIAWMRHQTTAYDSMKVARVKGARREVRRELAERSRAMLDLHRGSAVHPPRCVLCEAVELDLEPGVVSGAATAATPLADLCPGPCSSSLIIEPIAIGDTLCFVGDDGAGGALYAVDLNANSPVGGGGGDDESGWWFRCGRRRSRRWRGRHGRRRCGR